MVRDSVQLETVMNTISHEYLLEFTSEYGISEMLHPELPRPRARIVDFLEGKVDECVFPTAVEWRTNASKDGMPANGTYSVEAVRALDTHPNYFPFDCRNGPIQFDTCSKSGEGSSRGGKSLAAMQLYLASNVFVSEGVPADVSDPDPLAFVDAPSPHPADVAQSSQGVDVAEDPGYENASSPTQVRSPGSVYRPECGVTNVSLLDTPEACQDLVDHAPPSGYFTELRHMPNEEFLLQYNLNLARQLAMGSQLRLRFEQEAKLLRKSVAQVARRDQRIQARELEIKNLEALLETEAEALKAAFEDYRRQQDQMVEQRCAEKDARLDALSIDFDEELYPHMLIAIVDRRQAFADVVSAGVAKGMSEGLKHGVEHGRAQLTVESLEAYDPEAEAKFATALQLIKDLKYPLLDQLEGLKDAPMDVIMAALYLEYDTGEDAPQSIRDLRPSSSQLTIPVYPEVRDPQNPWACKEEIRLVDAIAANISRAEQKKEAA
uniref:Transposase (Putative), gypsy type n=1 Tax=Tanacetum cinerariifolium TaxID=118510 RepID=A0A6L2M2W7_TANCI|nr:hypothetical protein [Tanacetum cinerariifolium]